MSRKASGLKAWAIQRLTAIYVGLFTLYLLGVLTTAAPADYTIDQYHPDVEDLDPFGNRDTVVEQKLGFARRVADRFALLDRGRAVARGALSELDDELVDRYLKV